jgi:hypothetical protein
MSVPALQPIQLSVQWVSGAVLWGKVRLTFHLHVRTHGAVSSWRRRLTMYRDSFILYVPKSITCLCVCVNIEEQSSFNEYTYGVLQKSVESS